jgi:hypothetical protein
MHAGRCGDAAKSTGVRRKKTAITDQLREFQAFLSFSLATSNIAE